MSNKKKKILKQYEGLISDEAHNALYKESEKQLKEELDEVKAKANEIVLRNNKLLLNLD